MRLNFVKFLGWWALVLLPIAACADGPWWTGPLLAPAGHTIPRGHTNLELYGFYTENNGIFSRHWKLVRSVGGESFVFNPLFSHGLTDSIDVQYSIPYAYNKTRGQNYKRVSDASVTLGYQLLEQKNYRWRPDLRVSVGEIIPTGRFEGLDPVNNGADATGSGSYQTNVALNFQHLYQLAERHWLRSRLSLNYVHANSIGLHGFNSYGGAENTMGRIDPGDLISADLAAEVNLTQRWVAVMEGYIANRESTQFTGFPGTNADGTLATLGHGVVDEITLAPAVEYNFSENLGIIGGCWFTLTGKDTADFHSIVIALNAYW